MSVELGRSNEPDIVGRYGEPSSRNSVTRTVTTLPVKPPTSFDGAPVSGIFSYLRYNYVLNQAPIAGGDMNQKTAVFTFWNGVLVAYDFNSSFSTDSSNFDEEAADFILPQRKLTKDETIAQFGPPGGRMIYPVAPKPGLERLHYSYLKIDRNTRQRQVKVMDVVFDACGQMVDYRVSSALNPFTPASPAHSSGGVIFLPRVHVSGGRR